jgi:hypothetical protein
MANYPPQLVDMQDDVLARLGETNVSLAAAFLKGNTNDSPELISTRDMITLYLNEGGADLARACYPVSDKGSFDVPAGTMTIPYTSFTCTSGNVLWSARRVVCNGVELEYYSQEAFEFWHPTAETDDAGAPTVWYRQGHDGIGIYPQPDATVTTTVYGLAIPKLLEDDTDTASWLQPDIVKLMVYYAAAQVGRQNTQDPDLAARIDVWTQSYMQGQQDLLTRLWQTQPQLARFHYTPPMGPAVPVGAAG